MRQPFALKIIGAEVWPFGKKFVSLQRDIVFAPIINPKK